MMDRSAGLGQGDLLVRATNALEPSRIPPPIRTEVTRLLTRLMAEYLAVVATVPTEVGDE